MKTMNDLMINVEILPVVDSSPLKQVEECLNNINSFLSTNLLNTSNIFMVKVALKPDYIFSTGYLKSIISQRLHLFFNYEPPIISYSEVMNENGEYFSLGLRCFNDNRSKRFDSKRNYQH
jgi:hypothetical protein